MNNLIHKYPALIALIVTIIVIGIPFGLGFLAGRFFF